MEFGREVFVVPGNVTQEVSFAPNQWIKPGAKLVTSAEDVIEKLPTPVRAAWGRQRRWRRNGEICRQRTG
jgi:predicted Rossmann fold nucleotide-binding protein DprA/Smf involved in DNA uptake